MFSLKIILKLLFQVSSPMGLWNILALSRFHQAIWDITSVETQRQGTERYKNVDHIRKIKSLWHIEFMAYRIRKIKIPQYVEKNILNAAEN